MSTTFGNIIMTIKLLVILCSTLSYTSFSTLPVRLLAKNLLKNNTAKYQSSITGITDTVKQKILVIGGTGKT